MKIKKWFNQKINMTLLQRQSMIIVTLLGTLFLIRIWPRFLSDAMEVSWYVYVILIIIFSIPLFRWK